jgi:hypothetical protein
LTLTIKNQLLLSWRTFRKIYSINCNFDRQYILFFSELFKYIALMKIQSKSNSLELSGNSVLIRKSGLANTLAAGMNGERSIQISSITSIQVKLGTFWSPGYILFSYPGSKPFNGGLIEATQDPDAFIFNQEFNDDVTKLKAMVEKIMREPKIQEAPAFSVADELLKFSKMRVDGIISQDEFDSAKKKLLS